MLLKECQCVCMEGWVWATLSVKMQPGEKRIRFGEYRWVKLEWDLTGGAGAPRREETRRPPRGPQRSWTSASRLFFSHSVVFNSL